MEIKKFKVVIVLLCILVLGFTGCSTTMTPIVNTLDIKTIDFSITMKEGKSCQGFIIGFIPIGEDASIVKAAKNGGISKVKLVEHKTNYYPFYCKRCIVVHGQ